MKTAPKTVECYWAVRVTAFNGTTYFLEGDGSNRDTPELFISQRSAMAAIHNRVFDKRKAKIVRVAITET